VVALAECGTHAFVAAEVDAYSVGRRPWPSGCIRRLRGDELLTADRGFYSWQAWDTATARGRAAVARPDPAGSSRGAGARRDPQLASIKWTVDSRGRIKIESKDEMRQRGLPSPDRADTLAMVMSRRATGGLKVDIYSHPGESITGDLMQRAW
jgi:hypothetical protein